MKRLRIGLNGFGRIGRAFSRIVFDRNNFDIAAVNTSSTTAEMLSYLLKYDSVYRTYSKPIRVKADGFIVGEQAVSATTIPDPEKIPWEKNNVDIVIDCTGVFKKSTDLKKHLRGSVKT